MMGCYISCEEKQVLWFCEHKVEVEKVLPKELYLPKNQASEETMTNSRGPLGVVCYCYGLL